MATTLGAAEQQEALRQLRQERAAALMREVDAVARAATFGGLGPMMPYSMPPLLHGSKQDQLTRPQFGQVGPRANVYDAPGRSGGSYLKLHPNPLPRSSKSETGRKRPAPSPPRAAPKPRLEDLDHGAAAANMLSMSPVNSPALASYVSMLSSPELLGCFGDDKNGNGLPPPMSLPPTNSCARDEVKTQLESALDLPCVSPTPSMVQHTSKLAAKSPTPDHKPILGNSYSSGRGQDALISPAEQTGGDSAAVPPMHIAELESVEKAVAAERESFENSVWSILA